LPGANKDLRHIKTFNLISRQVRNFIVPSVTRISFDHDPYKVLVSCILSLRTKDKTTIMAANKLFKVAAKAEDMVKLSAGRIEKLIYPVGFYRNKAKVILGLSGRIVKDFKRLVPKNKEELLGFKGVGRKTANLVLGLGFKIPAICVDTHVHRISNRLGWVKTKSPLETEKKLEFLFPKMMWIRINTVLVAFGQNLCVPVSPFCSRCKVSNNCKKAGVEKSR